MTQPVSLALTMAPADVARLKRHPLLRARSSGRAVTRQLRTIYYDDPEHSLRRNGGPLAVRIDGRPQPAPEQGLTPLFDETVARTRRRLALGDASAVTLELAVGELRTAKGAVPIGQVDLGLETGNPSQLFKLALELKREFPFRIATASPLERGYRLVEGGEAPVLKAAAIELDPAMSTEAALRCILLACLDHLSGNEGAVVERRAVDGVHQMRVALRRLRAALSLFRRLLPDRHRDWIKAETRWLAGVLGQARDWDVFLADTLPPVEQAVSDPGLERLRQSALVRREAACDAAIAAVQSDRYTVALLELRGWIEEMGWRAQPVSEAAVQLFEPIGERACALLERRRRKVAPRAREMGQLSVEARHEVRKDLKKLRYAAEFFASLLPGKQVKRLTQALAALQDALGHLNDAATARRLVEAAAGEAPDDRLAGGMVVGWHMAVAERATRSLGALWQPVEAVKPFRC